MCIFCSDRNQKCTLNWTKSVLTIFVWEVLDQFSYSKFSLFHQQCYLEYLLECILFSCFLYMFLALSYFVWIKNCLLTVNLFITDITRELTMRRQSTFVKFHTSNPFAKNRFLVWVVGINLWFFWRLHLSYSFTCSYEIIFV